MPLADRQPISFGLLCPGKRLYGYHDCYSHFSSGYSGDKIAFHISRKHEHKEPAETTLPLATSMDEVIRDTSKQRQSGEDQARRSSP